MHENGTSFFFFFFWGGGGGKRRPRAIISINESCDRGIASPESWRKCVYSRRVGDKVNPVKGDIVIPELDESESTPGEWEIASISLKF